ncbi:PREDICTED: uncharacterized protein LOC105584967 isoform X2 [Cercocebus atys]|uniref:uncharacterized protein LOC105584967 isoform X2 n=1 Tax=Cercocebus atys TaxID=9531 RepID=UPI0005F3A981|nr:PREDICTED: uncharacterized protein LOC105584967 isoform X2 [Cercocebus atys]
MAPTSCGSSILPGGRQGPDCISGTCLAAFGCPNLPCGLVACWGQRAAVTAPPLADKEAEAEGHGDPAREDAGSGAGSAPGKLYRRLRHTESSVSLSQQNTLEPRKQVGLCRRVGAGWHMGAGAALASSRPRSQLGVSSRLAQRPLSEQPAFVCQVLTVPSSLGTDWLPVVGAERGFLPICRTSKLRLQPLPLLPASEAPGEQTMATQPGWEQKREIFGVAERTAWSPGSPAHPKCCQVPRTPRGADGGQRSVTKLSTRQTSRRHPPAWALQTPALPSPPGAQTVPSIKRDLLLCPVLPTPG